MFETFCIKWIAGRVSYCVEMDFGMKYLRHLMPLAKCILNLASLIFANARVFHLMHGLLARTLFIKEELFSKTILK